MLLSFLLRNFLVQMLKYFLKNKNVFLPTKSIKNHLKKLHTYGSWEIFFLCSPDSLPKTAQNFISVIIYQIMKLFDIKNVLIAKGCEITEVKFR